jgi:hypothetical protein
VGDEEEEGGGMRTEEGNRARKERRAGKGDDINGNDDGAKASAGRLTDDGGMVD